MPIQKIKNFFELEAAAGIILGLAAIIAIIIANSPFANAFDAWAYSDFYIQIGDWAHKASLKDWVKDGLMAIFFFHIGLEIKHEILEGELSDPKKLALPIFAAIGGMIMPAIVFILILLAFGQNSLLNGWPIPVATDIAFAIAALAVVSKNVPISLKIFLLTLAVIDDLGAIVLIAALYSHEIDFHALSIALVIFIGMLSLSRINIRRPWIFVAGGIFMWAFTLQSGFHATLAGIMTAICVPLKSNSDDFPNPLEDLHKDFSPWVKYLILPLFALTHAGFSFQGMGLNDFISPLVLAISLGLIIGKPIGVLCAVFLSTKLQLAKLPQDTNFKQILGVGALCGIGFTMSLFLGGLSYSGSSISIANEVKFGVFFGSIVSAIIGIKLLSNNKVKT